MAQPVRTRILEGLSIHEAEDGWSVRVGFSNPVRYLRHAPHDRGRFVHVQLENIRVGRVDIPPSFGRESLQAPPEAGVPLVEVTYDGSGAEGPALDLRFSRDVAFSIHQGDDFRSLRIDIADESQRITPPRPAGPERSAVPPTPVRPQPEPERATPEVIVDLDAPFALELDALPDEAEFPALPPLAVFRRYRTYIVESRRDGARGKSRRLGFFPDAKTAKQAAALLAPRFPNVAVIEVSRAERLVSESVAVRPPAATRPAPPPTAVATDAQVEEVRALVERAREALTAGDLDAAIRLLTKASTYPATPYSPEVKELIGVARERNGQLAHAKAAYDEYLAAYPDGEGAERVRQRLSALVTRKTEPREGLRTPRAERSDWDVRGYGSTSVTYFRNELFHEEATVQDFADDTAIADLNGSLRLRSGDVDAEARLAGDYRIDDPFQGANDDVRLSALFAGASDRELGLDGSLGRQSINTSGVLGRFDGGGLGYTFLGGWRVGAVAGYPVDFGRKLSVDTDRRFLGVSLDTPRLFDFFNGQIYALGQQVDGHTDRTAVGAELRYVADGRFAAAFVDYDLHFAELNSALLVANSPLGWDTEANLFLDYRYAPPLTTSNAVIGEPVASIHELRRLYTANEIEDLARDRSARTSTATLSFTKHLTEQLQVTADGTLSEVDGLPASGNMPAIEGTGLEYQVGLQLLASSLIRDGDIAVANAHYFDGHFSDIYGGGLNWRVPVAKRLRLNPRLDTDYRRIPGAPDALFVRPTLRFDWSLWQLTLDAEAGFEWVRRSGSAGDEYGYITRIGLRWDFP